MRMSRADIVMPVAGPVGLGSAALAAQLGVAKLRIIGVDADQYATDPEHKGVYLTSVLKNMDTTTVQAVKAAMDGSFKGGVIVGNLKSGGVGLAPFHDQDSAVPADLKKELDAVKGKIDRAVMRPQRLQRVMAPQRSHQVMAPHSRSWWAPLRSRWLRVVAAAKRANRLDDVAEGAALAGGDVEDPRRPRGHE